MSEKITMRRFNMKEGNLKEGCLSLKNPTCIFDCSKRIDESSSMFKFKSLVSLTELTILDGPVELSGK